jgi:hypothetical protein
MDALRTFEILITSRTPLVAIETIEEKIKTTKPLSVTRTEEVGDLREWASSRAVPPS